ncbi:MAG: hypothetical protein WAW80_03655 [Candidatus Saccharimonadales bacterium]
MNQIGLAGVLVVVGCVITLFGVITQKLDWRGISGVVALIAACYFAIAFTARVGSGWSESVDIVYGGFLIGAIAMIAMAMILFIVDIGSRCGWSPGAERFFDWVSKLLKPVERRTRF